MSTPNDSPLATILVVDDSPENITLLSAILHPQYRVRVATDGPRALTIIESEDPPDLVLLDVMMPGMTGFEVCAKLKQNPARRDVPIIFVTALGEIEDERRGLELGAIDYVTKPISPAIVSVRVRNHLELARARRALADQNAILEAKVAERTAELVEANRGLKESYVETIDLAYAIMSEADDTLGNHCKRVATYARALTDRLGFGEEAAFEVHVAALLHDVGLVGVHGPELGRLFRLHSPSPTEEAAYFAHPVARLGVLLTSERFERTKQIVAGHHENLDGSGFPAHAKGDAISEGTRVLAVADRWDIFARFTTPARGQDLSYETFVARTLGKLDPDVVRALGEVLREGDPFSAIAEHPAAALAVGMVVAKAIKTPAGTTLLSAGTTLRRDHIRQLERYAARDEVALPIAIYRDGA